MARQEHDDVAEPLNGWPGPRLRRMRVIGAQEDRTHPRGGGAIEFAVGAIAHEDAVIPFHAKT